MLKMAANMSASQPVLQNLRAMFYLVTPAETQYRRLEDVPNFVDNAIPWFFALLLIEMAVLKVEGKDLPRMNDTINSISHGFISTVPLLVMRSLELVIYVWIYNNWCLIHLDWDSTLTWGMAFLAMDFSFYWFHRMSHECNFGWAAHQVHHSSEDYNMGTALRQPLVQHLYKAICWAPMALVIPPQAFYTHLQFNLLYQFWIHTEVVDSLGPLEYILNTPSHHRVHHGRNPYCIDKNYAGVLIIWDRLFNTFAAEDEKVVYGLVHPNQFWNPIYGQACHFLYMFGLVGQYQSWSDKISAVVKGPGWTPGKPWTGDMEDLPQVEHPVRKYDSSLPTWANVYIVAHFTLVVGYYTVLAKHKADLTLSSGLSGMFYIIASFTAFGALFDKKAWGLHLEIFRCLMVTLYIFMSRDAYTLANLTLTLFYGLSAILWMVISNTSSSSICFI